MTRGETKLRLEQLENRTVPALLLQLDAAGNLRGIFGNTNEDVFLTWTADNTVNVDEGATDLGTYSVVGNLTVSLGNTNAADVDLFVDLGGFTHDGSMFLSVGNATNGFGVDVQGGTIAGELRVSTGNGADFLFLGDIGPVTVDGSVTVDMGGGNDNGLIQTTTIGGHLRVTNAQIFDLNDSPVGGVFSFDSRRESLGVDLSVNAGTSIGSVTAITTGAGADTITLDGDFLDHLIIQMGNGVNTLDLSATAEVLGSTTVVGGNAVDTVTITGSLLAANLTISLANGNDAVTLTGATVLGNAITILGGNGADALTVSALTAPGARFSYLAGNGNDTFTLDATTSTLFSLYYDGGFGTDLFSVTGVIAFPTTVRNVP